MSQYCVAITGGIGSGKTAALKFFESFGCDIISADDIAHSLTKTQAVKSELRQHFGANIFDAVDELNRKALSQIVFNDIAKRKTLESILHPLIRAEIIQQLQNASSAYCMIEIPLLKKRSDFPYVNSVLCIITSEENQIKFVQQRDNKDRQEILTIIASQISNQQRREISDQIIENNGTLTDLESNCQKLHQHYLQAAAQIKSACD
jgi:dephospho-CoA kinase